MNPFTGTDDQHRAAEALERFLTNDDQVFVLTGYAGTGKTWLIGQLTAYLSMAGVPSVLLAPTGRASRVLSNKTQRPASTIHRAIYHFDTFTIEKQSDLMVYIFSLRENEDSLGTVYIVDEASMVSDRFSQGEHLRFGSGRLLSDLIAHVRPGADTGRRIIFVGDPAQLPPVGSTASPALDPVFLQSEFSLNVAATALTQVVRQAHDSGILVAATVLRERIAQQYYGNFPMLIDDRDVRRKRPLDVIDAYLAATTQEEGSCIVVAHSNRQVRIYNDAIRARLFPDHAALQQGDKLLVVHNSCFNGIVLFNGDIVTAADVDAAGPVRRIPVNTPTKGQRSISWVDVQFRRVSLLVPGMDTPTDHFIFEPLLHSEERDLTTLEAAALFVDFAIRHEDLRRGTPEFTLALKEDPYFNCLHVKYGYAVTGHKAQGGEWQTVFADLSTAMGTATEDFYRWAYTAVSRARRTLHIINHPTTGFMKDTPVDEEREGTDGAAAPPAIPSDEPMIPASTNNGPSSSAQVLPSASNPQDALSTVILRALDTDSTLVVNIEHKQYSAHVRALRDHQFAFVLVHYNKEHGITKVEPKPGSNAELAGAVTLLLAPLQGTIFWTTHGDSCDADSGNDASTPWFADLDAHLRRQLGTTAINIERRVECSQYHVQYHFRCDGVRCMMNFFFNGKGVCTSTTDNARDKDATDLVSSIKTRLNLQ